MFPGRGVQPALPKLTPNRFDCCDSREHNQPGNKERYPFFCAGRFPCFYQHVADFLHRQCCRENQITRPHARPNAVASNTTATIRIGVSVGSSISPRTVAPPHPIVTAIAAINEFFIPPPIRTAPSRTGSLDRSYPSTASALQPRGPLPARCHRPTHLLLVRQLRDTCCQSHHQR